MFMEAQEVEEVVIVAVSKHSCSVSALKWTLANIKSRSALKLVHVQPQIDSISTSILVPSEKKADDLTNSQNHGPYSRSFCEGEKKILQVHKKLCDASKVQAEIVLVEGDQVANLLIKQALRLRAKKLIIGKSTKSFLRIRNGQRTSDIVCEKAAKFCTVIVISDGKLVSIKGPDKNIHTFSASRTSSKLPSSQQTGNSYVSSSVVEHSSYQALKSDAVANDAAQKKQPMEGEDVGSRVNLSAEKLTGEDEMQSFNDVEDGTTPMLEDVIHCCQQTRVIYRKYNFNEIKIATNDFAVENKIGKGGYGSVYRGKLNHTKVAIKVLETHGFQGPREFQQEVDFLGHMHHPNIILLLGACPERRCLVYEYLANGSLDDRLQCKDNTPPLPWHTRFRISAEVATALFFLHSLKPSPYVHRDVKPQNILLDSNFISKLGDVGLTILAPSNISYDETDHKVTRAVGTLPYMDPVYLMTGNFSPRSDVYGYGLVVLQLLTGKRPFKLQELVEEALNDNLLKEMLDPTAGHWPIREATELARIATRCANFKPSDRTDFEVILPQLEKLATFADARIKQGIKEIVPIEFKCPISEAIMENPHVAADGFTYELAEIQKWLVKHRSSPLTKLKLENKGLIPNHTLQMAIIKWQRQHLSM